MLSAEQILRAKTCEEIFVNNKEETKSIYRELAKRFHPDIYKGLNAEDNFAKINTFYEDALLKIEKGIWDEKDIVILESKLGKKYKLKYLKECHFELGRFYIGRKHLIYVLEQKNKKYYDNALKVLNSLKYVNKEMENEFKRYFPNIESTFELKTGEFCLVLKKDPTDFLLEDFYNFYKKQGKEVDAKHTAWVVSRLNNIACFLKYNNLVHNGLSMNNCLISPKYHTIMVLGGWWYCVPVGEKMIGTQKVIFDIMPIKEKTEKIASFRTDLESIRQIGRTLNLKDVPIPFKAWLNKASSEDAFKEFNSWNDSLLQSFGERKFIELDISEKEIYSD